MKRVFTTILVFVFGCAPLWGQAPDEKEKPKPEEKKRQGDQGEKQATQSNRGKPEEKRPSDAKSSGRKPGVIQNAGFNAPAPAPATESTPKERIPEGQFRANLGQEHRFRAEKTEGRRFQVAGFWFETTEPWPADWQFSAVCFVEEYGEDYYLVNAEHPEKRIQVNWAP